ncbi:MAG: 3-oxoadipate enol-lactonase [Gammaproteobacteria bacterium]|jgi:3-oxoadipate enol-lactonase
MPMIDIGPIELYYETHGSGPRLLYISGTGGDLRRHPGIFDSPLADQFEILAYDQRGLGQSGRPDVQYSMADYANDANGLMDALGWEASRVFGVSFGGMVSQEYALRFPEKVERVVLACTSSGGNGGHSYPLHELQDLNQTQWVRTLLSLSDTRRDATWRTENTAAFETMIGQMLDAVSIGADEPDRAMGARRQIEARSRLDTYARLSQLAMPVMVCGGRFDGIAPIANLEAIVQQIAGAKLELFDGGHMFYLQDPDAFERIGTFLLEEN